MHRLAVDIHVIGAEPASAPGLGQADRIEHVERDAMLRRGARHLPLAGERPIGARGAAARNCDRDQRRAETNPHRSNHSARHRLAPIAVRLPLSRRQRKTRFRSHSHPC